MKAMEHARAALRRPRPAGHGAMEGAKSCQAVVAPPWWHSAPPPPPGAAATANDRRDGVCRRQHDGIALSFASRRGSVGAIRPWLEVSRLVRGPLDLVV